MRRVAVLSLALFCTLAPAQSDPAPPSGAVPAERGDSWMKRHEEFVAVAKQGNVDLLFLGDSITDAWRAGEPKKTFDELFSAFRPANFGISGDRTQHLLWRLRNGELDGIQPKCCVVMIGTNNLGQRDPEAAASAIAGIKAVLAEIQAKCPSSRTLLLGIFPDPAGKFPAFFHLLFGHLLGALLDVVACLAHEFVFGPRSRKHGAQRCPDRQARPCQHQRLFLQEISDTSARSNRIPTQGRTRIADELRCSPRTAGAVRSGRPRW